MIHVSSKHLEYSDHYNISMLVKRKEVKPNFQSLQDQWETKICESFGSYLFYITLLFKMPFFGENLTGRRSIVDIIFSPSKYKILPMVKTKVFEDELSLEHDFNRGELKARPPALINYNFDNNMLTCL